MIKNIFNLQIFKNMENKLKAITEIDEDIEDIKSNKLFYNRYLKMREGASRWVTVLGVLGSGIILLILAATLSFEREQTMERAIQQGSNLSLIVKKDIERNFEIYNLSLQQIVDVWNDPEISKLPENIRRQVIFDKATTANNITSALILDAYGRIVLDLKKRDGSSHNFSDRDFFYVHELSADIGLYLSRPYVSRIAGSTNVALSRRLNNADGSFAGVALLSLNVEYFRQLLEGLKLGKNGRASIVGGDGRLIMSYPFFDGMVGMDTTRSEVFLKSLGYDNANYQAKSAVDNELRLYDVSVLSSPLVKVFIGTSVRDIYAAWWRQAVIAGGAALIFSVGLISLSAFFGKELKARKAAEDSMRQMANTDALTGLSNRRALDVALRLEVRRCRRNNDPLSVLFLDVDFFKKFNHASGHSGGDKALEMIGKVIGEATNRPTDFSGRYGGEEFLTILGKTDIEGAAFVAEKIRKGVEALNIPHPQSPWGFVTVSVGVAQMLTAFDDHRAVVRAADDALYRAKAQGRNSIVIAH